MDKKNHMRQINISLFFLLCLVLSERASTMDAPESKRSRVSRSENIHDLILYQRLAEAPAEDGPLIETATILLRRGANPTGFVDRNGNTALHIAAIRGYREIMALFLERMNNADLNKPNKEGETPLIQTVRHRHLSITDLLLDAGADVTLSDLEGWCLLHWAAHLNNHELLKRAIRDLNPNNLLTDHGETLLHIATDANCVKTVQLLLRESSINPNLHDSEGNTALEIAARNNNQELVRSFLANALVRVNTPNHVGSTALWRAAISGNVVITRMLLQAGADPRGTYNLDASILAHLAENRSTANRDDIARLLIVQGAPLNIHNEQELRLAHESFREDPLLAAAAVGNIQQTIGLLRVRPPQDETVARALHIAAVQGHTNIVNLLASYTRPLEQTVTVLFLLTMREIARHRTHLRAPHAQVAS